MADRSRTFTWDDPLAMAASGADLSGLERLQRIIDGELPPPPMGRLMDIRIVEVAVGRAVFEALPQEFHFNPAGVVHGGFAATVLDSAMGCAIYTLLPAQVGYTTIELKLNFVKGVTLRTGLLRAVGTVIHGGRSTALAEGRLEALDGTLYAHATTTCLIFR